MTNDITGFGSVVTLTASNTYPGVGIPLTQFADDADALDMPSVEIAQVAMGVNGNMVSWSHAQPLPVTISVVPDSEDDRNLAVLANNNRVAQGKTVNQDVINITIVYPNGKSLNFTGGKLTNAPFGNSIASSGRLKSKTYQFMFEKIVGG